VGPFRYGKGMGYLRDCQIAGSSLGAFATASAWKHSSVHQGNDLGYGKNAKDWIIRSQVLRVCQIKPMDAVQRLNGSRFWCDLIRA
jgi:hypothetical protein